LKYTQLLAWAVPENSAVAASGKSNGIPGVINTDVSKKNRSSRKIISTNGVILSEFDNGLGRSNSS
jgi:hypothetical protein